MSKLNTILHKWTRRDFLKTSARAGIFLTVGYPGRGGIF
ncbi:MAG: twin-arginine translocation signal domain-containing protein [Deltaproteobacteria bacterium]|nr:twin-arginine translocation signal domain-containing protein [Deltaproteobacteria bacterium]